MTLFIVNLVLAVLAALGGAAAVWFYLSRRARTEQDALQAAQEKFARETLARLQELTTRVAADVDQHSSCVQQINAQLACGDDDESSVLDAVSQLIEANQKMQQQLVSAEDRLQAQARQIESQAMEARTDALTQVANRRALDDELKRAIADFERRGIPTSVMLIDVDHFKKFNDTHGHQAGDEVLRGVARVLRNSLAEVGMVARYGGEEFAVVFSGLAVKQILPQAERARQAIATASFRFAGQELHVTASAGIGEFQLGDTEKDLVRRADEALYASKGAGRNCGHHNDGHTNHLIPAQIVNAASESTPEKVGDEWLNDAEAATEGAAQKQQLSHVSSRPVFFDDMIRRLAQWRRGGTSLSLVLVQVDGFSRIVSDHGPSAADVVLRVATQLMNAVIRDMDHIARLGEDTFAILLPGAELPHAVAIAERLRQAVERCRLPRKAGTSWFTISVGVVEACEGDDLRLILERVRKALHAAVNQGRNRVCGQDAAGLPVKEPEALRN